MPRLFAALLLALSLLFTTAHAQTPSFLQDHHLTVCTNPTLPPMTFVNGTDMSNLAGFDIDLATELGHLWNVPTTLQAMDFEGLFPSLNAGRCGMVISGILLQEGRTHNYDAAAYLSSSIVVVAKTGTKPLTSLEDLSGQTVAIQSGTSYGAQIERINTHLRQLNRPPIIIQQYPTEDQVVQQVLIGRVQAFISQDVELYYRQKQLGGKVTIILKPDLPGYHDFAVYIRKNPQDRAALVQAIATLRSKGTLTSLEKKWNISGPHNDIQPSQNTPSGFNTKTFLSALFSTAFLKGAAITLVVAILSHATAIVISVPVALKLNGPPSLLRSLLSTYVAVFRAAPTLLQLLFIWNALPQFFPIFRESWFTPFLATWISLSINESAYQVEINRAALQAVDAGQTLGAGALGMTSRQINRHIIFPQALRIALPPTINEFISLLKTTSLASVISLQELLSITQIQVARTFEFTEYYAAALIYYLIMVFALLSLQKRIETRFIWADRNKAGRHAA